MFNSYVKTDYKDHQIYNYTSIPSLHSYSRDGLESLKATLSDCLNSRCKPSIYVAPIPCGGGKSRTVQVFIAEWKADGFPGGGSVIIMLGTLDEVDSYIAGCRLDSTDFACLSPKEEYSRRGLGRAKAGEARVLFVTHEQMRRKVTATGSFEAVTEFHYHGRARTLRICDEGILPAVPVSVRLSTLEGLPDSIGTKHPDLARMIEDLRLDRQDRVVNHQMLIPAALREEAFRLAYGGRGWLSVDQLNALEGLGYLSGQSATLRQDNRFKEAGGLYLVGSSSPLPGDLEPCIIMDASAGLRHFYRDWASRTGKVELLPAPQVSYRNLDIKWWNTGAGKSTLAKTAEREKILGVVAATINAKPSERWLVIYPKNVSRCSIIEEIEQLLKQPNAEFLHWGLHLGKNEFRDIKNVIILGSHNYGQIGNAAHCHAAIGGSEEPSPEAVDRHVAGEFAHNVYQAACRSNLRNIVEGFAGDATVYIVTKRTAKGLDLIQKAFPGCDIEDWLPVPPRAKKVEQRFREAVISIFDDGRSIASVEEIWKKCGFKSSANIYRIWKNPSTVQFLNDQGLRRKGNSLIRFTARPPE